MNILHNNGYFAAANSQNGFVSFFDSVFTEKKLNYIYIIKGGSGTGKSRFMKEIGTAAKERKESTELFYCSSDPKSLDGIILKERKVAIIDGTAPHVAEPQNPGCFDEILNFAMFWDSKKLISQKNEITELQTEKKRLYEKAYSYLSTAGSLSTMADLLVLPSIKFDKLEGFSKRFAEKFKPDENFEENLRLTASISYLGYCDTGAFEDKAENKIYIHDKLGISSILLASIRRALENRGVSYEYSLDPLNTQKLNGIFIPNSKISVTCSENYDADANTVNCERFVDMELYRKSRAKIKFLNKCRAQAIDFSAETMQRIFKLHSRIEEIYGSAMNFDEKEEYTEKVIKRIFD